MKISSGKIYEVVNQGLQQRDQELSTRMFSLFEEIKNENSVQEEKLDAFQFLIQLILKADREPAWAIANLLAALNSESFHMLDDDVLSYSTGFLRDYLKKDGLNSLRTKPECYKNMHK